MGANHYSHLHRLMLCHRVRVLAQVRVAAVDLPAGALGGLLSLLGSLQVSAAGVHRDTAW